MVDEISTKHHLPFYEGKSRLIFQLSKLGNNAWKCIEIQHYEIKQDPNAMQLMIGA